MVLAERPNCQIMGNVSKKYEHDRRQPAKSRLGNYRTTDWILQQNKVKKKKQDAKRDLRGGLWQ